VWFVCFVVNPHFYPIFNCGGGSGYIYYVALCRVLRHTVVYACGAFGNLLNRNPSESASEFGIAIRNDRFQIPTPNYTTAPSSHFHASPGAPRRLRDW
jgi:hypothetical protein